MDKFVGGLIGAALVVLLILSYNIGKDEGKADIAKFCIELQAVHIFGETYICNLKQ